jgi:uncharacterized protein YuzE
MQIRLDRDVNALYITLQEGKVARTLELAELVYADIDEQGEPLGLEFVNADDFIPFLRERAGDVDLPASVRAVFGASASR